MTARNHAPWAVIFGAALFVSATGSPPETPPRIRPAIFTRYQADIPVGSDEKFVKNNCKFGLPKHRPNAPIGATRYVFHEGYVLEHSSELRIPLWVCEHLSEEDLTGQIKKRLVPPPFKVDEQLKGWPHAEPRDYTKPWAPGSQSKPKAKFARGHMAPDANRTRSTQLKAETYFLSNMVPQAGARFNSSVWEKLEEKVRDWAKFRHEIWIVTGVLVHDPREEDPRSATGFVEYFTIGKSPVAIPTHLFKIVLSEKPQQKGAWEAIAFVFANESYQKGRKLDDFLQAVQWIEERAGFDFFPCLPKGSEKEVRQLQAAALWN